MHCPTSIYAWYDVCWLSVLYGLFMQCPTSIYAWYDISWLSVLYGLLMHVMCDNDVMYAMVMMSVGWRYNCRLMCMVLSLFMSCMHECSVQRLFMHGMTSAGCLCCMACSCMSCVSMTWCMPWWWWSSLWCICIIVGSCVWSIHYSWASCMYKCSVQRLFMHGMTSAGCLCCMGNSYMSCVSMTWCMPWWWWLWGVCIIVGSCVWSYHYSCYRITSNLIM